MNAPVEPLEARRLLSSVELVQDLYPGTESASPAQGVASGGSLFFTADSTWGREVWRSDGTAEGTFVLDALPGVSSSFPSNLIDVGGTLFFTTSPGGRTDLWKSDGTLQGTGLVKSFPGAGFNVFPMGRLGSQLLFNGPGGLWISDGTDPGTRLITPAPTAQKFAPATGQTFFTADNFANGEELWRTDGTAAGTYRVKDINPGEGDAYVHDITAFGTNAFFAAGEGLNREALWVSDGTEAGTRKLRHFGATNGMRNFRLIGNTLYFTYFEQLWKSDGTEAGTVRVKSLATGIPTQSPAVLAATYFFTSGGKLWKSNGTDAGTVQVDNAAGNLSVADAAEMVAVGGRVYFKASTPANGLEPWSTDGTTAGTRLVKDMAPGAADATLAGLVSAAGKLFFAADSGPLGRELWVSDGTDAGTRVVEDVNTVGFSSIPRRLVRAGNRAFFFSDEDATLGLWKTDGTGAGTLLVERLNVLTSQVAPAAVALGDALFFTAPGEGSDTAARLWKSDGTAAGTAPLSVNFSSPAFLTAIGGRLFFTAHVGSVRTLFVSDGTPDGTVPIRDGRQGGLPLAGSHFVGVGGVCYYAGNAGGNGFELWRSDGTAAGTYALEDLRPGPSSSWPSALADVGGSLMFIAHDGAAQNLYRSNGAPGGATVVKRLSQYPPNEFPPDSTARAVSHNGLMYFAGSGTLWRSDGTEGGTFPLRAGLSLFSFEVAPLGGRLFFAGSRAAEFTELWSTDGTAAGTVLVKDINPGGSADPRHLTASGGLLYFPASGTTGRTDLWRSDGTPGGTARVPWPGADDGPGAPPDALGPFPADLLDLNGTLLLAGTATVHGRELWKVRDEHAPAVSTAAFRHAAAPHALTLLFTEPLTRAPAAADVTVRNVSTGTDVPRSDYTATYDPATSALTVRFTAPAGGVLPDGNYRVTLAAGSARDASGNAMAATYAFDFFALTGDVNRDRSVNGTDFALLAANFGKTGMTYAAGDLNGDGAVNGTDFALLAGNFGRSIPEPAAAAVAPSPALASAVPASAAPAAKTIQPRKAPARRPRPAARVERNLPRRTVR